MSSGNKFGVVVIFLTASSKGKVTEALTIFFLGDNVRVLVTVEELGQHKEVQEVVLSKFSKEFTETCVIE